MTDDTRRTAAARLRENPQPGTIEAGEWWALVRGPRKLPVVFSTFRDARENADPDEHIVKVRITGCVGFRARRGKAK